MNAARLLRHSRRAAGLTQRELAARAGVPQSTVGRIESGRLMPRVDTFDRLLRAAGRRVIAERAGGEGVDRTQMRVLLGLTPLERLELAGADGAGLDRLLTSRATGGD